jgi:hypothetical protein
VGYYDDKGPLAWFELHREDRTGDLHILGGHPNPAIDRHFKTGH